MMFDPSIMANECEMTPRNETQVGHGVTRKLDSTSGNITKK